MDTLVVIPARMGSTRFPGKPLVDLCGKPMIQWVVEAARRADIGDVVVATPDDAILDACRATGAEAIRTRPDHPSGTDRIAEVSESRRANIYVNVQGDEPLIRPESIHACAAPLLDDASVGMGSVYAECRNDEVENAAVVKVVTDLAGFALYFSRYPIPYPRTSRTQPLKKHLGIYAYRREVVQAFARWPQSSLEQTEGLEQLRFLENGVRIRMSRVAAADLAVDTPEQADEVRRLLMQRRD